MSSPSEQYMSDSASNEPGSADIVPCEPPLSELQRSVQWRAQAANDADREREYEARRPRPLKLLIIFLLAMVPVVMIFGAVDAFLRVYYRLTKTYLEAPAHEVSVPIETPPQHQPGIVLLQPYENNPANTATAAAPSAPSMEHSDP